MTKIHDELKINDKSIISESFFGVNTVNACEHLGPQRYVFPYLIFDVVQVRNELINKSNKCNFSDCFNYYYYNSKTCNSCNYFNKQPLILQYSPKILVIFLDNNNINSHYFFENEIDLKKIQNQFIENKNGIYKLMSVLYYNNEIKKFIVHYWNIQKKSWTYSNINNNNVFPLMLFYQLDENNNQELQGQQLQNQQLNNNNLNEMYEENLKLKKEINKFENHLIQKETEINKLKFNLKKKKIEINKLKTDLNKKEIEIKKLTSNLNQKVIEINELEINLEQKTKEFKCKLDEDTKEIAKLKKNNKNLNEELNNQNISLILMSYDEGIQFSIICKKTDEFSKIKNILDRKYPDLKNNKKIFKKNGNIINQDINLEKNNIQDGDTIIFT